MTDDLVQQPDRTTEQGDRGAAPTSRVIFTNQPAFLRLATSVVIDQHDEWQVAHRYPSQTSIAQLRRVIAAKQHALDAGADYDHQQLVDHCA